MIKDGIENRANTTKVMEYSKYAKEYGAESVSATHYLADLLTLYKESGCNMDDAVIHMYCPDANDKSCNWVYQNTKPDKSDKTQKK